MSLLGKGVMSHKNKEDEKEVIDLKKSETL